MSDEEDFLEDNSLKNVSSNSARMIVLRNPQFKTPHVQRMTMKPSGSAGNSPGNSTKFAPLKTQNFLSATPMRGPNRFLRVVCPDSVEDQDDEDEEETFDDENSIKDAFWEGKSPKTPVQVSKSPRKENSKLKTPSPKKQVENSRLTRSAQRLPFSPIRDNDNVARSPSRLNSPRLSLPFSPIRSNGVQNGDILNVSSSTPSLANERRVSTIDNRASHKSFVQAPVEPAETPKASRSIERLSKARKKLSITQSRPDSPDLIDDNDVDDNESDANDSPFFKVPLPPPPVQRVRNFVLRKATAPHPPVVKPKLVQEMPKVTPAPVCTSRKRASSNSTANKSNKKSRQEEKEKEDEEEEEAMLDPAPMDADESDSNDNQDNEEVPEPVAGPSNAVPVASSSNAAVIEDVYDQAKYVTNWIPKMKSKKMIVEGDLLDFA